MANPLDRFRLPKPEQFLPEVLLKAMGNAALAEIKDRIQNRCEDVSGNTAPPYSPRGPIYIQQQSAGGSAGARRVGVTRKQFRALKTQKFENYAQFKEALGRSGNRDLTVTGAMMRSLRVLSCKNKTVNIGFSDPSQESKMRQNLKYSDSWGISESDEKVIGDAFETLIGRKIDQLLGGRA